MQECQMNIRPALIPNPQATILIEPGPGAFHYPAVPAQALRRLDAPARNPRCDASAAHGLAQLCCVVGFIGVQLHRPFARASQRTFNRSQCIESGEQHVHSVDAGRREGTGQWDALTVDHKMALRARFAAIRWSRPSRLAPFGASTVVESIAAQLESIRSASPSQFKKTWWSFCHTPAACHSFRRRQHVMLLSQPSSGGSWSQAKPVLSTKRIPVKTARFDTCGRPPLADTGAGGSRRSIPAHNSTDKVSFAISFAPPLCLSEQWRFC